MHLVRVRLRIAVALGMALMVGISHRTRAAEGSVAKNHGPIAWTESVSEAQKTAAKEKKLVFIDFWAEWCGPCKAMLSTTYKDNAVVSRSKKFVPVLIDADKHADLVKKYDISALPTVVFLNSKGKVLLKSTGYASAADFLKLMDQAAKKAKS